MPPTPLSRFQGLFRGRETAFGQWVKDAVKTLRKPATEQHWKDHLNGKGPILGIVPVRLDNTCYFGAIDVDDDVINHAAVAGIIEAAGLPLVVCRSKSGAAHLYQFFSEPVPAELVKEKLRNWANAMGFVKNPDESMVEVFPKNAKLKSDDPGNWINLPYYGAKTTTRKAIKADGSELSLSQFLDYAESKRISEAKFNGTHPAMSGGFSDGPPCLQALDQVGYPDGSRNMGIYNVGIYFKLAKPDTWQEEIAAYNKEKMDPPLKDRDIKAVIKSLENKDYVYKCDDLPIAPHCKKAQCKKQPFGIDVFRKQAKLKEMPPIGGLKKVLTDPPRWLVTVDGIELDLETDQLMILGMFRKVVLERCNRIIPMLKSFEWDEVLAGLLKEREDIAAPEDAGVIGQFISYLNEFLLRRFHATTMDDVVAGLPFEPVGSGKVYFRSSDLNSFLEKKKFRDFDTGKLFTVLRNMQAGYTVVKVKKVPVQVWSIPIPETEQTTPLDSPPSKGHKF